MSDTVDNDPKSIWYDAHTDLYIRPVVWWEGDKKYMRKIMMPYYWAKTNIPEVKLGRMKR